MAAAEVGRLYQGVAKESAAFKLMKQMGWEEGEGLGKHKQGISTHVRVSKKFDNSGIGVAEARKESSNWTVNTAIFDSILKNLNVKATGQETGTVAKVPVCEKTSPGSDGEGARKERGASPDRKKVARPQGRYRKREAGKCVKSYSESDLSAILGVSSASREAPSLRPVTPADTTAGEKLDDSKARLATGDAETAVADVIADVGAKKKGQKRKSQEDSGRPEKKNAEGVPGRPEKGHQGDKKRKAEGEPGRSKKKKGQPEQRQSRTDSCGAVGSKAPAEAASPVDGAPRGLQGAEESVQEGMEPAPKEPPADWWGHRSGFIAGGVLGSMSKAEGEDKERGFSERDQEGLYHLVNNTATSGKKGLGVGSMPKKVAGARWEGKKLTFQEEGCAGDEAQETSEEDDQTGEKSPFKQKEPSTSQGSLGKTVPWKKIILRVMKKAPKGLSMEELRAKVIKKASKIQGSLIQMDQLSLEKTFAAKVQKLEGKLAISNDLVRVA